MQAQPHTYKNKYKYSRIGEVAQQLRELVVLPEEPVPGPHTPFWILRALWTCGTWIYVQANTHTF